MSSAVEAFAIFKTPTIEVWAKPLANDDWAIAILNRTDQDRKQDLTWPEYNVFDDFTLRGLNFNEDIYSIQDLWTGNNIGTTDKNLKVTVSARDVLIYRLSLKNK